MCILFIYTNPNPGNEEEYRVVIVSNRDEYFVRPSKNAFLCEKTNVIGGTDMEPGREGGMWLGISLNKTNDYTFRCGALLNVSGENRSNDAEGRGFIVANYIQNSAKAKDYIEDLHETSSKYNAFNFVAVELSENSSVAYHLSNTPQVYSNFNGKQVLGFGNSTLLAPLTKVINGRERFTEIINKYAVKSQEEVLIKELLSLLQWNHRHLPDLELQRRLPNYYQYSSSIFIKSPVEYGTRAHSVILVDYNWNVNFIEMTLDQPIDKNNPTWSTTNIVAKIE